ncbi:MAG: hypothetical protein F6K05_07185 [Okeania sp. SIO1H2]|nr:hypothetical protein [Okeania sp. SIO1H2]
MLKSVYDINLNYLGVNPPLTSSRRGSYRVRREQRRRNRSRRRKFFARPLIRR